MDYEAITMSLLDELLLDYSKPIRNRDILSKRLITLRNSNTIHSDAIDSALHTVFNNKKLTGYFLYPSVYLAHAISGKRQIEPNYAACLSKKLKTLKLTLIRPTSFPMIDIPASVGVALDFLMVMSSSALVLDTINGKSVGASMETLIAVQMGVPVYSIVSGKNTSPFTHAMSWRTVKVNKNWSKPELVNEIVNSIFSSRIVHGK